MKSFGLVVVCCGCIGHAHGIETPQKSLSELLFAQHPTGARHGNRIREAARGRNAPAMSEFNIRDLAGVSAPMGYFDPLGLSKPNAFKNSLTEGELRYYREAELKHGRAGMLGSLGIFAAEKFGPGGSALDHIKQTGQDFWWEAAITVILLELSNLRALDIESEGWTAGTVKSDHVAGDMGFDPLKLKPKTPELFKKMQTKEINNGRLGMLGAAGMIAQEMVTGQPIF